MSDNKRKLRSSGSTTAIALDKTKVYKLNSSGAIVEATSIADDDIVFTGSKSSLRRIADLERNVSILAAKSLTEDGSSSGFLSTIDYATRAGKWATARTLSLTGAVTGSVSIDGSGNVSLDTTATSDPVITLTGDVSGSGTMTNLGNVSISATIQPNSVALGTDTTGNYMVNVTGGTGISVSHTQGEGSTASVAVDTTTIATRSYADSAAAAVKTELLGGAGAAFDTLSELKSLIDAGDASLSSAISGLTIGNGTFTVSAGSGMTGGGTLGTANQTGNSSVTLSHADTSSAADLAASSRRYVTGLTFDTYGHVTGYSTATETVVDTDTITTVGAGTGDSGVSGAVKLVAGSNVSISRSGQNVTISSTDTNTTYSAGTGLSLSGTTFSLSASTSNVSEGSNLYYTDARARASNSAGTGISYNSSTGVITNSDLGSSQNIFKNVAVSGQTTVVADSNNDTLTFAAGSGISITTDATTDTVTITNSINNTNQLTNGAGYITGITSGNVTSALGYTPYNSTNPNGYVAAAGARSALSFAAGSGAYNSSTGVITIPTNTNQLTNGAGFVTSSGVTSVATGNGLTGGTITGTGTVSMSGSYTGTFTVTGDIRATGEVTAYYSDSRLKTNVSKIDGALNKVMAINGYTYDSSELAESLGLPKHMDQIGLLADEVEAVLPELVTQSAIEGYKTIRYDKVVSVLVNAVKEQQAQIEELQALVKKTLH